MEDNKTTDQKQIVTIKLNKYKSFVDSLGNRKTAYRVVFTLFLLGILLFVGITVITLSIKRLYPYSDITTNALGATTIKSEKKEVSYWLFNTAILWANSGIQVHKGDVLTIRASGKSNTAIHHLYDAAKDNKARTDRWVGSEGEFEGHDDKFNNERRRFRIFPNMPSGALLMQVCSKPKPFDTPLEDGADDDNFYFIGKERQNIYINETGTLYFAVNDIVLNRGTIAMMMSDIILNQGIKGFEKELQYVKTHYEPKNRNEAQFQDSVAVFFKELVDNKQLVNSDGTIGNMNLGWTTYKSKKDTTIITKTDCELTYYYGMGKDKEGYEMVGNDKGVDHNSKCKSCWYDDNVGSFLIIVEKTSAGL